MKKSDGGLFRSVNVATLLEKDVTEAKLDVAFTETGKQAMSQDIFLFFLAGHGKTIEGKYHFIPQDFRFNRRCPGARGLQRPWRDDPGDARRDGQGQCQWRSK